MHGGGGSSCLNFAFCFAAQSNRILEHTQKIGKGYGFMIFCFYLAFSVILHMLHYFNR
jgi:hypothetical protein